MKNFILAFLFSINAYAGGPFIWGASGPINLSNPGQGPLTSDSSGNIYENILSTVTYASSITTQGAKSAKYRIIATGNLTINVPSSQNDDVELQYWVTSSGGAYTLSLASGIVIPSSSSFTSPYTMTSGKKVKVMLQYDGTLNGGQWELTSLIGNY